MELSCSPALFSQVAGDAGSSAFCTHRMTMQTFFCIKAKINAAIVQQYREAKAVFPFAWSLHDAVKAGKKK